MPCEKHGPRASVTTKTSAFGLGFCLLSPSGHDFHTAWETMIKSYTMTLVCTRPGHRFSTLPDRPLCITSKVYFNIKSDLNSAKEFFHTTKLIKSVEFKVKWHQVPDYLSCVQPLHPDGGKLQWRHLCVKAISIEWVYWPLHYESIIIFSQLHYKVKKDMGTLSTWTYQVQGFPL